jgi:hypothetical protein
MASASGRTDNDILVLVIAIDGVAVDRTVQVREIVTSEK